MDSQITLSRLLNNSEWYNRDGTITECPNCGRDFEQGDETWESKFCPNCGQALKWEFEEERVDFKEDK